MKTKTFLRVLVVSAALLFVCGAVEAQITIGSELSPNAGALLDLKETTDSPGANSTKGVNFPRVNLTALNSLAPCYTGADAGIIEGHRGLTVYNTNAALTEGLYTWDGAKWSRNQSVVIHTAVTWPTMDVTAPSTDISLGNFTLEPGWYLISANSYFSFTDGASNEGFIRFYVSGIDVNFTQRGTFKVNAHQSVSRVVYVDMDTYCELTFRASGVGRLNASGQGGSFHVIRL